MRPIRFVFGGERTLIGRGALKVEHWLLHYLHVMGAEAKMRHEIEMHGSASGFLAEGLTDQLSSLPSNDEVVQRARRDSGADTGEAIRASTRFEEQELGRGQRQVESFGGDRSRDIHETMLHAQRKERQRAERQLRRRQR